MCHATDPISGKGAGTIMQNANGLHGLHNLLDPGGLFSPQTDPAAAAAAAAEKERQAQINAALKSLDGIFSSPSRQAEYKQYGTDTFNTLKDSLDQNERTAARNLNFGLVRSGNLGGSEDIVQHGILQRDYSKGLLNASNQAQGAQAQLEGEDQALKSNITNLILNGMSATDATQQAMAGLQTNIQGAKDLVAPATLDSTFGDLAQQYLNGKAAAGAAAANGGSPTLGSYFTTAPNIAMNSSNFDLYDPNYLTYGGGQ